MKADLRHNAPLTRYAVERAPADLIVWLENRERYIAQSAATTAGCRAELPARAPISRELHPPK